MIAGSTARAGMSGRPCGPYVWPGRFRRAACATGAADAGAAVDIVPRNSGLSGFPSGPERGCDNCLACCSVTITSPGITVSSGPADLRVCAQLSPGRRQLQVGVSRPFDIGRQSEAPYTAARSAKRPEPFPRQDCDTCKARPPPPGTSAGRPAHRRGNGRARSNKKSENKIRHRSARRPYGTSRPSVLAGWRKCRRCCFLRTVDRRNLPVGRQLPPNGIADRIRCCRGR